MSKIALEKEDLAINNAKLDFQCSICWSDTEETADGCSVENQPRLTKCCKKIFHFGCLIAAASTSVGRAICPICRNDMHCTMTTTDIHLLTNYVAVIVENLQVLQSYVAELEEHNAKVRSGQRPTFIECAYLPCGSICLRLVYRDFWEPFDCVAMGEGLRPVVFKKPGYPFCLATPAARKSMRLTTCCGDLLSVVSSGSLDAWDGFDENCPACSYPSFQTLDISGVIDSAVRLEGRQKELISNVRRLGAENNKLVEEWNARRQAEMLE